MKTFILCALCFTLSTRLFAQETVTRDTINLRGIVYDSYLNPVPNITVYSKQLDLSAEGKFPMATNTDNQGKFSINGAMRNDTLSVASFKYKNLQFYNNGSRVILILLPPEKILDMNSAYPIEVNAPRVLPKPVAITFSVPTAKTEKYFVEQMPDFPGGYSRFLKYIQAKVIYPDKAIKNNIEGTVQILFTVKSNGQVDNIIVSKGIGYGCDEELVQIIASSPMWHPGMINGTLTAMDATVSVKFSLKDK